MKDRNPSFRAWIFFNIKLNQTQDRCIKKEASLVYDGNKAGGWWWKKTHRKQLRKMHTKTYDKKKWNESKGKKELGERCSKLGSLSVIQQSSASGSKVFL